MKNKLVSLAISLAICISPVNVIGNTVLDKEIKINNKDYYSTGFIGDNSYIDEMVTFADTNKEDGELNYYKDINSSKELVKSEKATLQETMIGLIPILLLGSILVSGAVILNKKE